MSNAQVSERSRKFYEQIQFPGKRPIDQDGLILLRHFSHAITEISGTRRSNPITVLDAGCGTGNTAVALARRYPDIRFVGIDQSGNSLSQGRAAALREELRNLRFRKWDLMKPIPGISRIDVVLCLGVLHHTADMKSVLVHLRRTMKKSGVLFLWIYGKLGRYWHTLNARALRILLMAQKDVDAVELAMDFVRLAGKGSAIPDLLGKVPVDEMQRKAFLDPVWVADQFMNPHERLLDMEELVRLVKGAGFTIERILGKSGDIESWLGSPALLNCYRRLPEKQQRIVLDLLEKPERYFVILRPTTRTKG